MLTYSQIIEQLGRKLYGQQWRTPLAKEAGLSERHLRRIHFGQQEPTPGVHEKLLAVCAKRDLADLNGVPFPPDRRRAKRAKTSVCVCCGQPMKSA